MVKPSCKTLKWRMFLCLRVLFQDILKKLITLDGNLICSDIVSTHTCILCENVTLRSSPIVPQLRGVNLKKVVSVFSSQRNALMASFNVIFPSPYQRENGSVERDLQVCIIVFSKLIL